MSCSGLSGIENPGFSHGVLPWNAMFDDTVGRKTWVHNSTYTFLQSPLSLYIYICLNEWLWIVKWLNRWKNLGPKSEITPWLAKASFGAHLRRLPLAPIFSEALWGVGSSGSFGPWDKLGKSPFFMGNRWEYDDKPSHFGCLSFREVNRLSKLSSPEANYEVWILVCESFSYQDRPDLASIRHEVSPHLELLEFCKSWDKVSKRAGFDCHFHVST